MNTGSTDNIAIRELAAEIRDYTAPELNFEYAYRYAADADHTHADTTKAGDLIGYDPQQLISTGVSRSIDWYRTNRDWYEPLVRSF